jgi:hypothetical protein
MTTNRKWAVLVEGTTTPPINDNQAALLLEQLDGDPSTSYTPTGKIIVQLSVTAADAFEAVDRGEERVRAIVTAITGFPIDVVSTFAEVANENF